MNKKIFGIKLSTILTAIACLVISFAIWVIVKYNINYASGEIEEAFNALSVLGGRL